ncbi:metalloendoproteinase 1-MMP-like [Pyrus x bretschneideri]|uniref:metalloendoproteinase 1-MMP-like n=1 Tax=Pyrus x bretschneideri TaxID=225117 RepID=UPI00202F2238|nr:metalloendoproteinase 1-MMP-like [Pyrus x bretschneideri]
MFVISSATSAITLKTLNLANILILIAGSNYKKWRREIGLLLTINEYDIVIDTPRPMITEQSTRAKNGDYERWTRANKIALSILESGMTDTIRGGIKKHELAAEYLNAIEKKFQGSQKAKISQYMSLLTTNKIDNTSSIMDHITKMTDAEKLNSMDVNIAPQLRLRPQWRELLQHGQETHFSFSQAQSYENADLKISFGRGDHGDGNPFDGRGGTLAHAFAPTIGRFQYDADEPWAVGAVEGAYDLETVALHEIGHLLGRGHSSVEGAVMSSGVRTRFTQSLHADDIQGIKSLYSTS